MVIGLPLDINPSYDFGAVGLVGLFGKQKQFMKLITFFR